MSVFRTAVKLAAVAADVVRPPVDGVVILLYHRVGARTASEVDLPVGQFDEQIAALAESGRASTLDEAVDVLAHGDALDTPPIVVTFDDGTADVVEVALPILERHGVPALLYLSTAFVDEQRAFPDGGVPLSWAALREGVSTGLLQVGSHTHTHRLLDRVDAATAVDELDRSVDRIQSELGVDAEHFAYPKAVAPSAMVDALVRDRFVTAALAGCRPNPVGATDLHALARTPMQRADRTWFARRKIAGGLGLEDRLRERRNSKRYAQMQT